MGSYFKGGVKPVTVWLSDDYVRAVVGGTGEEWLTELSTDDLRDLVHLEHGRTRAS